VAERRRPNSAHPPKLPTKKRRSPYKSASSIELLYVEMYYRYIGNSICMLMLIAELMAESVLASD
jgi:hypothetical protein